MMSSRPGSLRILAVCLYSSLTLLAQQQPPPVKPQPPQQKKANPFETVPQSTEPPQQPKPQLPKLEQPKPAEEAKPTTNPQDVVEAVEFRGNRRVPGDTLRALIVTKAGDKYD